MGEVFVDVCPLMIPGRGFRSPCTLRQRSSSSGHLYAMEGYPNRIAVYRTKRGEGRTAGKTLRVFHGHNENIKMAREKARAFSFAHFFVFPDAKHPSGGILPPCPCADNRSFSMGYEEAVCGAVCFSFLSDIGTLLGFPGCSVRYRVQGQCPWRGGGAEPPIVPQAACCLLFQNQIGNANA